MHTTKLCLRSVSYSVATTIVLGVLFLVVPTNSPAQCTSPIAGEHVVYNSSSLPSLCSTAYIDLSSLTFGSGSQTLCNKIYQVLAGTSSWGTYPAAGTVIDARGLNKGATTAWTCNANESPWWCGTCGTSGTYANKPSVILLPAGVITTSYTWVFADRTLVIGQGAGSLVSGSIAQWGTVLTAATGFTGPAGSYNTAAPGVAAPIAMIQLGDPGLNTCNSGTKGVCFHIGVEDLTLNAASQAVNGILNMDAQELSHAKRVNLINFSGSNNNLGVPAVGLQIGASCFVGGSNVNTCNYYAQGQNSGPYEQIYYSGSGTCAQIYGAGIRGFHGITCVGSSGTAPGILLDSSSNTLEDVTLSGFPDGIKIGSQSTTGPIQSESWGNELINVTGSAGTNLIHVCSTSSGSCVPSGTPEPQDLNILAATSSGGTTIQDDITTTKVTDSTVGLYALGEPATNGSGNSRFTTSPNFPTWFFGTSQSVTSLTCPSTAYGSIYTSTGTSGTGTIWGCVGGSWTLIR